MIDSEQTVPANASAMLIIPRCVIHGPENVYVVQVGAVFCVTDHVLSCGTEKVVRSRVTARITRHATISTERATALPVIKATIAKNNAAMELMVKTVVKHVNA